MVAPGDSQGQGAPFPSLGLLSPTWSLYLALLQVRGSLWFPREGVPGGGERPEGPMLVLQAAFVRHASLLLSVFREG